MAAAAYVSRPAAAPRPTAPELRVVRGGRRRLDQLRSVLTVFRKVLCVAVLLGMVVSLVYSQAVITELTGEIEATRSELTAAQSTNDYLASSMDAITSRANIEQIAEGSLGLVKADASQYTYIRLEDESIIEKSDQGAARLFSGFRTAALSLIGTLDP